MSLRGQINKISGDIERSVKEIARGGLAGQGGAVHGTRKICGYVCAINEDGDLAGTVDVQEYDYYPDDYTDEGAGHHKGVKLSAIQNNQSGVLIVPMLYSDVMVVQDPLDKAEYVVMYSHAKQIQMLTDSIEGENDGKVELGVTEVEAFSESDEGIEKDYDELEPTKNSTKTVYTAKSIIDQIVSPDDEEGFKEEKTFEHKIITVGDTKITIDGQNVIIETSGKYSYKINNTVIEETDGKIACKVGDNTSIEETDSQITIKTTTAKIDTTSCEIKGSTVKMTGGTLITQGVCTPDMNGPYNAIKACPFSGAPHCGSTVSGT